MTWHVCLVASTLYACDTCTNTSPKCNTLTHTHTHTTNQSGNIRKDCILISSCLANANVVFSVCVCIYIHLCYSNSICVAVDCITNRKRCTSQVEHHSGQCQKEGQQSGKRFSPKKHSTTLMQLPHEFACVSCCESTRFRKRQKKANLLSASTEVRRKAGQGAKKSVLGPSPLTNDQRWQMRNE